MMYVFFVLGIVPGTNLQINFMPWLIFSSIIGFYIVYNYIKYLHTLRSYLRELTAHKVIPATNFHTRLR